MMRSRSMVLILLGVFALRFMHSAAAFDYADALAKSILYYEGQRSGRLPESQRVSWRGDSGLQDGLAEGVDLVGGYYDAGDNVKFGLPMAFTITMLSWSAVEYRTQIAREGQLEYIEEAIRWGTDYLIKAHPEPNVLWGQVGDGVSDHECWQRPEDMTTPRKAYKIDVSNPGSDLAGETSAAMSAASLALRNSDPAYANLLVEHAKQLFEFADKYRGKYDNSIQAARNFYTSKSGYADELLWAALWLYEATSDESYLEYAVDNAGTFGGTSWSLMEFSWDVKYPGVQVLASKILLEGRTSERYTATLQQYQNKAEFFLCAALQKNNGAHMQKSPGGMLYVRAWNNMQYVVTASFLLTVYSDYLAASDQQLQCPRGPVESHELLHLAKSQADYILGDNPRATSYLIGFGQNYPSQVHHRGSSIVSIKVDETFVSCRGGFDMWYQRKAGDPNVLTGAIVGGPDLHDNFADERYNYEQTEPTSYNNGPLIGVLARLLQGPSYKRSRSATWKIAKLDVEEHVSSKTLKPEVPENEEVVLAISQRMVGSWTLNGQVHYKYEVTVKNTSREKTVKGLLLRIRQLQGRYWGLSPAGSDGDGSFTFPEWLHSLGPLQSFVFVYAHPAPQAEISLDGYST